jgi:hypothetical protein
MIIFYQIEKKPYNLVKNVSYFALDFARKRTAFHTLKGNNSYNVYNFRIKWEMY